MSDPRTPNIGEYVRGTGTLIEIQDGKPPPPPPKVYIFEVFEAETDLYLHDRKIQNLSSIWDFHGLKRSISEAIKEAKEYCKKYGVDGNSESEVRVTQILSKRRCHQTDEKNYYVEEFKTYKPIGSGSGGGDPVRTIVWTSKGGGL